MKTNKDVKNAISKWQMDYNGIHTGYKHTNNKIYNDYLSNESFEKFVTQMKQNYKNAYNSFNDGNGNELSKTEKHPPKMAATYSSSRLAFNLFKDKMNWKTNLFLGEEDIYSKVEFEVKLPEEPNCHKPNMDIVLYGAKSIVYIESKFTEIYKESDKFIKEPYKNVLDYLEISTTPLYINKKGEKGFNIDIKTTYFDIKQTICHLLGISKDAKKHKNKTIIFCDLFFDPTTLQNYFDNTQEFNETLRIFNQCLDEIKKCDISKWFIELCERENLGKVNFKHLILVNDGTKIYDLRNK